MADNPPITTYVNKRENRITFRIKIRHYLQLLMPESIKLLGSIKSKTKDKTGENIPRLKITEVVLVHCNIASNDCQRNSRVLQTFFPNKLFCQLLDISLKKFLSLKNFISELSYIEVWLLGQNSKPLEIEDEINITLVINKSVKYQN